ncbi:MAG: M16 family metallopeptidase [Paracoccaceae bacterium]
MIRVLTALWVLLIATPALAAVEIQEVTTEGGIDAWLVEEPAIPIVALDIRIEGGTAIDEPGKRGATNLMMALLEEGAGDMDARAFQAAREDIAASFGFRAYDDTVMITADFLKDNQDEAIALLREALVAPRFDQDAIDRVRAQVLSGIASDAKNPSRIASAAFDGMAFGDHPYGTSPDGTVDSVSALTREDMLTAHRNALVKSRIYVGAVGDITPEELSELLDALLGDLPQDGPDLPADVDVALDGGVTVIDFETPQSVALFGHEGIERDDEDFFAAYMINHRLGGSGFESRLMNEVREKRGLTYGIRSYLVPKFHAELIQGNVASSNATIAEAIEVTRAEWERMATEGMTQDELDQVKTYLTGEYPLRFDGNAEIASILVGMQVIGLPPDYVINRNDYIEDVTVEDINRVASELLRPDDLHFVIVGQPEGLEQAAD